MFSRDTFIIVNDDAILPSDGEYGTPFFCGLLRGDGLSLRLGLIRRGGGIGGCSGGEAGVERRFGGGFGVGVGASALGLGYA